MSEQITSTNCGLARKHMRRRRRAWTRRFVVFAAALGLVYFGGLWLLRSAYAAEQVTARIGEAVGAPLRIAGLDLGFSRSSLFGLQVLERDATEYSPPWLTIGSVDADLSLPQLMSGNLADGVVKFRDVHVTLRFDRDGQLLTKLPAPRGEGRGTLPLVKLENGAFTLQQEGRPDETFYNIGLELRADGSQLLLSGGIDDPFWGPWNVVGSKVSATAPVALNLKTRQPVHVTPAMLKRTPFVPPIVWHQVTCEGDTPCEVALQFNPANSINYRVALEPRNTRVYVRAIELNAEGAQGHVVIADDVLTLENVRGNSAGGELKLRSLMDFRGVASMMRFSIEAGLLSLAQLPIQWNVPAFRGQLSGKAELEVTAGPDRTTVRGDGEGIVRVPLLPRAIKVRIVADGQRIRFNIVRE
jgi:hypothetical protein